MKLCECGCGYPAPIAQKTNRKIGHVAGEPVRYIRGHVKYNGGVSTHHKGYKLIRHSQHPRTDSRGYVSEHVLVMEQLIGRFLQPEECVHHIDEDKTNNSPSNLMLCANNAEHKRIHLDQRAERECGERTWRKCKFCGTWADPKELYVTPNNKNAWHRVCYKEYMNIRKDHYNRLQRERRHRAKTKVA